MMLTTWLKMTFLDIHGIPSTGNFLLLWLIEVVLRSIHHLKISALPTGAQADSPGNVKRLIVVVLLVGGGAGDRDNTTTRSADTWPVASSGRR
jgi:hypothetical protein